ncbi:hypothetical protein AQUCO_09100035v1 [Aquilegia coerulea]|nr:hypothetical protein AQUCO_09100035v1 [Aquilegia coerulea]
MECNMPRVIRYTNKQWSGFSPPPPNMDFENIHRPTSVVCFYKRNISPKSVIDSRQLSIVKYPRRHSSWRLFSISINLEEKPSTSSSSAEYLNNGDEVASTNSSTGIPPQKFGKDTLKSLLSDSQRSKLINKVSEANQHNRFLKRQLQIKEDALLEFKGELAVMELEIQALVALAEEVAKSGIPSGSRKINGKYVQSHLLSRLKAVHEKLKEQIKDVDAIQSKEVPLSWFGMAESVQVMGSFDGWSQGEHLSPEYTGSLMQFSTTLMLRPGR